MALAKIQQKETKQKEISNASLGWMLFKQYVKCYKKSFIFGLIAALLSTLANILVVIGLGDLTKMINLFIQVNEPDQTVQLASIFILFGGLLILSVFIWSFLGWISNLFYVYLANKIGYQMRFDLFNKVNLLSIKFFDQNESGAILSILSNDVFNFVSFLSQAVGQAFANLTAFIGMLILMFLLSPYLALVAIFFVVLFFSLSLLTTIKKSTKAFVNYQKEITSMNGYLEEIISGSEVITLFNKHNYVLDTFAKRNAKLIKEGSTAESLSGMLIPWLIVTINFTVAAVVLVGGLFILYDLSFGSVISNLSLVPHDVFVQFANRANTTTTSAGQTISTQIGLLTAFILATRQFIQPINQLIAWVPQLQNALAGTSRIANILNQKNEQLETETIKLDKPVQGHVRFNHLNFEYVENTPVLTDITLDIKKGTSVAIVGQTGSGKTTIINLLSKFYDLKPNMLFIDDLDIVTIDKSSLRAQVSLVLQDTFLFSQTIKQNLKNANLNATDEQIYEICKSVGCDEFITKLKDGYDTMLSENGQELSNGQKQLIAIAMAMLSPSSLLILDEATSNIDSRTEKIVQQAVLKLLANKTSFVIAHRLSTIKNADLIVVLKDGKILEKGNHEQLMQLNGYYASLNNVTK